MRRPDPADEAGVTLVELLVAMVLLGVILAATAGSLISFSRAAVDNERRVQATALQNELHEQLQALPWFEAVVYEDEVAQAAAAGIPGIDLASSPPTYTPPAGPARPLVLREGPSSVGCDADDPDCNRRDLVPRAWQPDAIERDGITYEVFQAVTWADEDAQIKRFTTVVRWRVLGRTYVESFESERAATAGEAGDPTRPRVIQFQAGPSPSQLDDQGRTTAPIEVVVRFSQPVGTATLRYHVFDDPPFAGDGTPRLRAVTRSLAPEITVGGLAVSFAGSLPAGAEVFPTGVRPLRVVGALGGDTFVGNATVLLAGGPHPPVADPDEDGEIPPVDPDDPDPDEPDPDDPDGGADAPAVAVAVGPVTVSRTKACTDQNDRLVDTFTVEVAVDGMTTDDHDVSLTYTVPGQTRTESLEPVGGADTMALGGQLFRRTFVEGADHGFTLPTWSNNASHSTTFTVTASRRSDDGAAGPVSSQTLTVTKRNNPNKNCD